MQSTMESSTIAGVPYVALAPEHGGPAPLVITWHLLEPPRSELAMAAAVPMTGVNAWRVHLGLPMTGSRVPEGGFDEFLRLAGEDYVLNVAEPTTEQAAEEFPAVVRGLRERLPITGGPVAVAGGSAGATVALEVVARGEVPIAAAALVSPVTQLAPAVARNERMYGVEYPWTSRSRAVAERYDYVRRSGEIDVPVLLVVGAHDDVAFTEPAAALATELGDRADLVVIDGMGHEFAEEPGVEAAPQTEHGRAVDAQFTRWFRRHLG